MNKYRSKAAPEEWYHCYNRGVEKRVIFNTTDDYKRFQLQLLCANSSNSFMLSNVHRSDLSTLFTNIPPEIDKSLVEIGAYALMPNHFHIVLKELVEGGRAKFMQKLITGYTMYFNKRHQHVGPILSGTYKSIHVGTESYLRQVTAYVLLNPVDLTHSKWKTNVAKRNLREIERLAVRYRHGSGYDQLQSHPRPEGALLGRSMMEIFDAEPKFTQLVREALVYYQEHRY